MGLRQPGRGAEEQREKGVVAEVAKLAGVPNSVIKRAKSILADLEQNAPKIEVHAIAEENKQPQLTMADLSSNALAGRLREMQIETMTPIEAMNALYELKKLL